jgi:outer membrane immunogenic protein
MAKTRGVLRALKKGRRHEMGTEAMKKCEDAMTNKFFPAGASVVTRSCLLGFGFVLAAAACAAGADLPAVQTYKAPTAPAPYYNWNGFYAGVNVGGAWDDDSLHQTTIPNAPGLNASIHSSGVAGGGQLGFNWVPAPTWLLGIEADVSGGALKGTGIGTNGNGLQSTSWSEKVDAFGTARGRLGYVANNWLFYGTGGFAWSDDTLTRTQLLTVPTSPVAGFVLSNDATRTGWAAGGGIEWGFARNWAARLEYLHLDLSDQTFSFTTTSGAGTIITRTVDEGRLKVDTVRVGVSYLFN